MEALRRLIRLGHIRNARVNGSRGSEPYGTRRISRPSASEIVWLCLMLVMSLVTVLDLHASARRESQRAAARFISAELKVSNAPQQEAMAFAHAVNVKPQEHVTRRSTRKLRVYTKQQVQDLIRRHASAQGLDPDLPLAIARCESGFRWDAANGRSSARGVFQFLSGTWRTTKEGRKGTSVLDTEAHIRMAVAHIATIGTGAWNASRGCWAAMMSGDEKQDVEEADPESEEAAETDFQSQDVLKAS